MNRENDELIGLYTGSALSLLDDEYRCYHEQLDGDQRIRLGEEWYTREYDALSTKYDERYNALLIEALSRLFEFGTPLTCDGVAGL